MDYRMLATMLIAATALLSCRPSSAAEVVQMPTEVYVDLAGPAYGIFQSIGPDATVDERDRIRAQASDGHGRIVPWDQFLRELDGDLATVVVRRDYPEYDLARAITCLIRSVPGAMWAITWNGGIAFTSNDYDWAEARFKRYREKPDRYRPTRDQRLDPVNPGNFLPMFNCGQ